MTSAEMSERRELLELLPVPKEFLDKFTHLPKFGIQQAEQKWIQYLSVMRDELLRRLPFMNGDTTYLSTHDLHRRCGRFYPYGAKQGKYPSKEETKYVYTELYPLYPFYAVTIPGNDIINKISQVKIINQNLIDILIDTADHGELVALYYGDMESDEVDKLVWIPIDLKSLDNYIKSSKQQLQTIDKYDKPEYYHKILRSCRQAKYIKIITEFMDNDDKFPMRIKPNKYDRTYYQGLNLQNCHKEVRNAALGDNHQYDIEAAVYAIRMMLIEDIYREQNKDLIGHYIYTKEYLDHKSDIRNRLAKHITKYPDPVKLVKKAITAIGFGARITGGVWMEDGDKKFPAIHEIIMNEKDRTRFLNDPWVIEFTKEQKLLTNEIIKYYKNKVNWCEHNLSKIDTAKNKSGHYRNTSIISFLFQKLETLIMHELTKDLDNDNIILIVHDCIITKHPINGYDLQDMRYKLQNMCQFLKISNEFNKGWLDIDTMSYEIRHKQFIEQEERTAKNYKSNMYMTDDIPVYKRYHEKVSTMHDDKCYDSYDDGRKHLSYDVDNDIYIKDMTIEQRSEHYRIVGHEQNSLPDFIQKIMK